MTQTVPTVFTARAVRPLESIDFQSMHSPAFVLDETRLRANMELLEYVQQASGASIICALKGYSLWSSFPLMRPYLKGTTASSLWEAELGADTFGGEVHVYAAAYTDAEFPRLCELAHHISFNSFAQWERFKPLLEGAPRKIEVGIRINPEYSENATPMYDPTIPFSRLGVTRAEFKPDLLEGISGMHFHTLSAKGSDTLERTLGAVEEKFGEFLPQMKWVNMGGGHAISQEGYDVERLIRVVRDFREKWGVDVILEPGEAVGWKTGWLVSSVLDTLHNGMDLAILDVSASAHMPDTLEMPYRPDILGAGESGEKAYTYQLGGGTCLAGDIIGTYSFDKPLEVGQKLIFEDMIHYTMVKTTFFNGVKHPDIAILRENGTLETVREFTYQDFKARLS